MEGIVIKTFVIFFFLYFFLKSSNPIIFIESMVLFSNFLLSSIKFIILNSSSKLNDFKKYCPETSDP